MTNPAETSDQMNLRLGVVSTDTMRFVLDHHLITRPAQPVEVIGVLLTALSLAMAADLKNHVRYDKREAYLDRTLNLLREAILRAETEMIEDDANNLLR